MHDIQQVDSGLEYLTNIERDYEWGEFCYLAVPNREDMPYGGVWRIGVVARGVRGYRPLAVNFWSGPDVSAFRMAFNMNKTRLHLGRRDVMFIIASALERQP